jgi:hypothetical protein
MLNLRKPLVVDCYIDQMVLRKQLFVLIDELVVSVNDVDLLMVVMVNDGIVFVVLDVVNS